MPRRLIAGLLSCVAASAVPSGAEPAPRWTPELALRLSGAGWRRLTPARVATAILRITPPYPGVAAAVSLLLTPAILVLFFSAGPRVLFTMAVVGPLAVVPSLMVARVLGLTLHYERGRLSDLFPLPEGPRAARGGAKH